MIPLNTTWDTILMLLIAGTIGLIGGIAAALLEARRADKRCTPTVGAFVSSMILGAIAAVAILYFFPPQEMVESGGSIETEYSLTKLVALALIVGSAGTSFLLVLQTRTLALAAKASAETTEETATQRIGEFKAQIPEITDAGVESSAPALQKVLEETSQRPAGDVPPELLEKAIEAVREQTRQSVEKQINPLVEEAKKTVEAAGPGEVDAPFERKVS
jgi:hypothetical protein